MTGFALTESDSLRVAVLASTGWHLDMLAKTGLWTARADVTNDILGRFGLGRN